MKRSSRDLESATLGAEEEEEAVGAILTRCAASCLLVLMAD